VKRDRQKETLRLKTNGKLGFTGEERQTDRSETPTLKTNGKFSREEREK